MAKILKFLFLGFIFFVLACNKSEDTNLGNCSDGFMNNGETGIDCGGPCLPCDIPEIATFSAAFYGSLAYFSIVESSYDGTFYVHGQNDSIQIWLRFDNIQNPAEGQHPWPLLDIGAPIIQYNGTNYNEFADNSLVLITENANNKISGYFQLSLPLNGDTLQISGGNFSNVNY